MLLHMPAREKSRKRKEALGVGERSVVCYWLLPFILLLHICLGTPQHAIYIYMPRRRCCLLGSRGSCMPIQGICSVPIAMLVKNAFQIKVES